MYGVRTFTAQSQMYHGQQTFEVYRSVHSYLAMHTIYLEIENPMAHNILFHQNETASNVLLVIYLEYSFIIFENYSLLLRTVNMIIESEKNRYTLKISSKELVRIYRFQFQLVSLIK